MSKEGGVDSTNKRNTDKIDIWVLIILFNPNPAGGILGGRLRYGANCLHSQVPCGIIQPNLFFDISVVGVGKGAL